MGDLLKLAVNPHPEWMDKSFFEKVVRHVEKDPQASVEEFNVVAGSKPGDNFASSVYLASISLRSKFTKNEVKTISVFIKVNSQATMMQNSSLFRNEMEMFDKILPEIESLWAVAGYKELLCPK